MDNFKKFGFVVLAFCPSTHPFAYRNGNFCCQTGREKMAEDAPDRNGCNGSDIQITSTCCANDYHMECPDGKCSTRPKGNSDLAL